MAYQSTQANLENISGPTSGLLGIGILGLIGIAIVSKYDPDRIIYATLFALCVLLSFQSVRTARREKQPLQNGPVVFFLLVWLGLNAFTDADTIVYLPYVELTLGMVNNLFMIPLILLWMQPYQGENFFGLQELGAKDKIQSVWKFSVLVILLIRGLSLPTFTEILVLIPLIIEPVMLYKEKSKELPLLTLHIHQELTDKFAVPISMGKGIVVIMTSFTFGLLNGNLWLLVILGYLAAGLVWFLDSVIPEESRGNSSGDAFQKEMEGIKQNIEQEYQRRSKAQHSNSEEGSKPRKGKSEDQLSKESVVVEVVDAVPQEDKEVEEKEIVLSENATIGEKAHALGRKVRTELKKPQYNLNHILSTLSQEDFTTAYRVSEEGLVFDSLAGHWSPPKDLVLFPIELEEYDYRRIDEILLLGFNKPIDQQFSKFETNFGDDSKYNARISGDQIQIGDTTFHMKTLTLTRKQWENTRVSLELINDVDDISYTGFNTLHDLQEKLTEISEKWILLRKQAEEAAINFLAGLLGSKDPIFLGKNDIEKALVEGEVVEIEDVEDVE